MPSQARLVIPVLGAGGGSGRSTTAGLLACSLASAGSTVVLDTTPRLSSPWPSWPAEPAAGLLSLPPYQPITRRQVLSAASWCPAPGGRSFQALTDHQAWSSPPLPLPTDPAAWYQLAAAGGWQTAVIDTAHAVTHDIVSSRCDGRASQTSAWCSLPFSVPVLCAPATGPGVHALQTAVKAASAEGLPLRRMVITLVAIGEGRLPPPVKAAATMLQSKVSTVVHMPFEPHIRAHGLRDAERLKPRVMGASSQLVHAVISSAHQSWGEPLPPAPVPAHTAVRSPPVVSRPPRAHPAPEGLPR